MRRRHLLAAVPVAAAALAAGSPLVTGHPARAAASDCPTTTEEVCVWPGAGYSGQVTVIADDVCHDARVGSAADTDPDPQQDLRVYPRPGCAGTPVVVGPGAQNPNVTGQSYVNWHAPGA